MVIASKLATELLASFCWVIFRGGGGGGEAPHLTDCPNHSRTIYSVALPTDSVAVAYVVVDVVLSYANRC